MNEFLEWLKTYIKNNFAADTSITKTVTVEYANKAGNTVSTSNVPQVQIQLLDNSEVERYTSFDGEHISSMPIQITAYTGQTKISNVMKSAQESSIIFGQKIEDMFAAKKVASANPNVERCVRITTSPALQLLDDSKVYFTATRFNIWLAKQD